MQEYDAPVGRSRARTGPPTVVVPHDVTPLGVNFEQHHQDGQVDVLIVEGGFARDSLLVTARMLPEGEVNSDITQVSITLDHEAVVALRALCDARLAHRDEDDPLLD
jgi:hypothetical protein